MSDALDFAIYKDNFMSIKNTTNDVNLQDREWDPLFNFIHENSEVLYFMGDRLNYSDSNLLPLIESLQEEPHLNKGSLVEVFFRIKSDNFFNARKFLSELWYYYEYPALLFCRDKSNESKFITAFKQRASAEEYYKEMGTYLVYRSFQQDVIWIGKSKDMPLPPFNWMPVSSFKKTSRIDIKIKKNL